MTESGSAEPAISNKDRFSSRAGLCVCPLCGNNVRVAHSVAGYPLQRCHRCRLEFLHPQPDDSCLASIYSENYFLDGYVKEGAERMSSMKSATAALYLDELERLLPIKSPRFLEIGCGHGDMLVEAQRRGFRVSGVEFSEHAVAIANRRLGQAAAQAGTIDTVTFSEEYFDAVAFADVIEHVRDPQALLQRVHRLLKPGGVLMLITPSLDSWSRRVLGSKWMEYKVEHLFYFSRRSIRLLFLKNGFCEIWMRANHKILTLDYLSRHFERFQVPVLSPLMRITRRVVSEALAYRQTKIPASGLIAAARKEALPQ